MPTQVVVESLSALVGEGEQAVLAEQAWKLAALVSCVEPRRPPEAQIKLPSASAMAWRFMP